MNRSEAAERIRIAISAGVIDVDDLTPIIWKNRNSAGIVILDGPTLISILNEALKENNVFTPSTV